MSLLKKISSVVLGLALLAPVAAQAESYKLGVGEWAPYIGADLPDFGPHAKVVTETFAASGNEVEYEFAPWKRSLELAARGDLLATFPWSKTDERAEEFFFPETPVAELPDVFFYRKDKHPNGITAKSFEEAAEQGLKAVGIAGYWYENPMKEAGMDIHIVANEELAWKFLEGGRADVLLENDVVGAASGSKVVGDFDSTIGMSEPFRTVPMYIMFSKAHPDGQKMAEMWDANAGM